MNSISDPENQNEKIKSKIKNRGFKLQIKKNLSSLAITTSSIKTSNTNYNKNKKIISLFIEKNPFHYKLPLEPNNKNTFAIFSERKYRRKKLMDSIETFSKNVNLKYKDYNNNITDLMSKYLYSNPEADTNNITQYELTKSKINFYKKNKDDIENYLSKSKSSNKFNLHNLTIKSKLGYDEENNRTRIKLKNNKYQGPIDSFGLLLRNKIVHDKILLNYQDKEVQKFSKSINKMNNPNKLAKFNKRIKITSIIPTIVDNDIFSYNNLDYNSKNLNLFDENENNQKELKEFDRMIFLEYNDFLKGSVYLLCNYFRPSKIFPESREEFCMNYDPLSNSIYLFSGNSSNINSDQIWKYSNNNYTWKNLKSNNYMVEPRRGHSGLIYKNKYYIFGGQFLHSREFAKLDIYNFQTNTWTNGNLTFLFFKLRRNHICCQIGPQMLIHGGIDENDEILDDTYLLNLNNNLNWSKANIMLNLIPPKLSYHSCCFVISSDIVRKYKFTIYKIPNSLSAKALNKRIKEKGLYVFGGKNTSICNDMWLLKVGKKPLEWVKLVTYGKPPCPRYLCSMNFFENVNFIIIHGGKTKINDQKFALNDTYLFELYRYEWLKVDYGEKEKIVKPRCSHCSVICRNKLYIFGGINDETFNGSSFFIINLDINKGKENLIMNKNNNNYFKKYQSLEKNELINNNAYKKEKKQNNTRIFNFEDKYEKEFPKINKIKTSE